jgi:hypothetical protein
MARKQRRFRHRRRQERWALNCERVFSVLTSGPFPTGSPEDDLIDAHLSFCPDCRRLAEALRPTREMLANDSSDLLRSDAHRSSTADKLPGYWNAERRLSALDDLNFEATSQHASDAANRRFDWRWAFLIGLGIAVTVGVLIGLYQVGCLIDAAKRA